MRILSWNVLDRNRRLDDALAFVRGEEFDVCCLQEVPPALLQELRKLPLNIVWHLDCRRLYKHSSPERYLVICSPHELSNVRKIAVSSGYRLSFRTRLFVWAMKPLGWSRSDDHGALFADVHVPDCAAPVTVASVHVRLAKPTEREKDRAAIFKEIAADGSEAAVCGDFNVIETWWLKTLNWFLGAPLREAMPWYSEREAVERELKEHGFQNPLRGQSTHAFHGNQLDHILIPRSWYTRDAHSWKDRHGSDHCPIMVEVEPESRSV